MKSKILAGISIFVLAVMCSVNIYAVPAQDTKTISISKIGGILVEIGDVHYTGYGSVTEEHLEGGHILDCFDPGVNKCEWTVQPTIGLSSSTGANFNIPYSYVSNMRDIAEAAVENYYSDPTNTGTTTTTTTTTTGSEVHNFIYDNQAFYRTVQWSASSIGTNNITITITIAE